MKGRRVKTCTWGTLLVFPPRVPIKVLDRGYRPELHPWPWLNERSDIVCPRCLTYAPCSAAVGLGKVVVTPCSSAAGLRQRCSYLKRLHCCKLGRLCPPRQVSLFCPSVAEVVVVATSLSCSQSRRSLPGEPLSPPAFLGFCCRCPRFSFSLAAVACRELELLSGPMVLHMVPLEVSLTEKLP